MKALVVASLALAFTAVATSQKGTTKPQATIDIANKEWRLFELNGKRLAGGKDAPRVVFSAGGKLTGNTGVNSFSATYTLKAGKIKIVMGMQTLIAGPPALAELEKAFTAMLPLANRAQVVGGALELRRGSRLLARFSAGAKRLAD